MKKQIRYKLIFLICFMKALNQCHNKNWNIIKLIIEIKGQIYVKKASLNQLQNGLLISYEPDIFGIQEDDEPKALMPCGQQME